MGVGGVGVRELETAYIERAVFGRGCYWPIRFNPLGREEREGGNDVLIEQIAPLLCGKMEVKLM